MRKYCLTIYEQMCLLQGKIVLKLNQFLKKSPLLFPENLYCNFNRLVGEKRMTVESLEFFELLVYNFNQLLSQLSIKTLEFNQPGLRLTTAFLFGYTFRETTEYNFVIHDKNKLTFETSTSRKPMKTHLLKCKVDNKHHRSPENAIVALNFPRSTKGSLSKFVKSENFLT